MQEKGPHSPGLQISSVTHSRKDNSTYDIPDNQESPSPPPASELMWGVDVYLPSPHIIFIEGVMDKNI